MTPTIERHFLGWDAPALPRAAAWLAERYTEGDALRLDRCTVVLPGARAGRRLKELLVEVAAERAVRLVPPRVTTIGHLPELLYDSAQPAAEPALARRAWAHALRALPAEQLAVLFVSRPAEDDVRGWTALGREAERLHAEVAGAGMFFRNVAAQCDGALLYDDQARWAVLAEAQAEYMAVLDRLQREDRDLARIAGAPAAHFDGELCLVGVIEMPRVVRRLIDGVGAHVLVHAPATHAEAFDAHGCVQPEAWRHAELPLDAAQLTICDRPADQAAAVLERVARLEARWAADEIVVAVPDGDVVAFLEQRFEAAGVPTRHATGTAIERTRPYRLLEAVAAHLDGADPASFAALVRHPDLGAWLVREAKSGGDGVPPALRERDGWLETLDRYLREHLPARIAGDLPAREEDERDRGRRNVVSALRRLLEPAALLGKAAARPKQPLAVWAPAALELLLAVYGERPVDRARPSERRLLEACRTLRDAAAALYRLPPEVDEPCTAATALRLILDEARGEEIPPEPDQAAIELLGPLELYLDDAPVVFVTGANEPYLPRSVNADPFLPNALRTRLGLVDNDRRYARDACQLTALLNAREVVHVFAGRRSATGDPLIPSRLLLALRGRALAERTKRFFADRPVAAGVAGGIGGLAAGALAAGGGAGAKGVGAVPGMNGGRGFQLPPELVLHAAEPIEQLSVTAFRALIRDPYGFALERILRLRKLDDNARELDPPAFGELAHAALERFGASADAAVADVEHVHGALDRILDGVVTERFGAGARNSQPAVRLQVEQVRARLHAFAAWHARRVAAGWRVVAVEAETPEGGVPFDVDGQPFRLTGRIDRIEHNARTGEWALFDYKTGDAGEHPGKTHCRGKAPDVNWIDLQLPLYRHILPHVRPAGAPDAPPVFTGGDVDAVQLGYITLCADLDAVAEQVADWGPLDLAGADARARDAVRELRANAFVFREADAGRVSDDLAALVGIGTLKAISDDDDDDADADVLVNL